MKKPQSHNARDQAIQFQAAKLRREFARNSEQQKILLGAPPTSQIEEGVSVHNGREDGEQSFRHVPCFTGFAVVRA
jgi:hypothetical protein